MSAEHIGWAFRQKLTPTRKLVLVALADRCNKDTLRCDPTIERLVDDTGLSERAVRQALADLVEAGLLGRQRPRRSDGSMGHYRYTFPQVRVAALPPAAGAGSPAAAGAGKPEVVLEPEVLLAAAPQNGRQRNEIWDTLTSLFGEPSTRTAQTGRGKVVASLRSAGATPDEIISRAKRWALHFDQATLTEHALEKHWDTLPRKPLRRTG